MRTNNAAGIFDKGVDRFDEFRLCRVCGNIKNENFTVIQAADPIVTPVVAKAAVVGFVPPAD